ncbi:unnamed protein product [Acanthosepion pharaonis]|uniref:Uncharacterized protein n=1 Tax=Acanthosepion pharaonis TaxID=158019 RepID=A0A812DHA5_ACAPH|nr:unnamed protein product [Sepia pharaonis]
MDPLSLPFLYPFFFFSHISSPLVHSQVFFRRTLDFLLHPSFFSARTLSFLLYTSSQSFLQLFCRLSLQRVFSFFIATRHIAFSPPVCLLYTYSCLPSPPAVHLSFFSRRHLVFLLHQDTRKSSIHIYSRLSSSHILSAVFSTRPHVFLLCSASARSLVFLLHQGTRQSSLHILSSFFSCRPFVFLLHTSSHLSFLHVLTCFFSARPLPVLSPFLSTRALVNLLSTYSRLSSRAVLSSFFFTPPLICLFFTSSRVSYLTGLCPFSHLSSPPGHSRPLPFLLHPSTRLSSQPVSSSTRPLTSLLRFFSLFSFLPVLSSFFPIRLSSLSVFSPFFSTLPLLYTPSHLSPPTGLSFFSTHQSSLIIFSPSISICSLVFLLYSSCRLFSQPVFLFFFSNRHIFFSSPIRLSSLPLFSSSSSVHTSFFSTLPLVFLITFNFSFESMNTYDIPSYIFYHPLKFFMNLMSTAKSEANLQTMATLK